MTLVADIKQETNPAAVNNFLEAVNPFAKASDDEVMVGGGEGGEGHAEQLFDVASPFNATRPCMSQMDGSLSERLISSHAVIVYDVLKPLISAGEDMSRATLVICKGPRQHV